MVSNEKGTGKLDADSVEISIGYEADDDLFREVYGVTDKKVWLIGDTQVPATIMMAIRDGSAAGAIV